VFDDWRIAEDLGVPSGHDWPCRRRGLERRGPCTLCFGLMQAVCGYFFASDPTPPARPWTAAAVTRP
jgi:hypothetical protein